MNKIYDKGISRIENDLDLVKIIKNQRDIKVVMDQFVKNDHNL